VAQEDERALFHPLMLVFDVRLDHVALGGEPFFVAGVVVAE
jgi:hypothetical protein